MFAFLAEGVALLVHSSVHSSPFAVSQSGEMAAAAVKVRVVADPAIGVSDLEQVLEDFIGTFPDGKQPNMFEFLKPPGNYHWKSAPCPKYLSKI